MMIVDSRATRGGAWVALEEGGQVRMRVDPQAPFVEFEFLGAVEMSLNMPEEMVRRFRDMCTEALRSMSAPVTL